MKVIMIPVEDIPMIAQTPGVLQTLRSYLELEVEKVEHSECYACYRGDPVPHEEDYHLTSHHYESERISNPLWNPEGDA